MLTIWGFAVWSQEAGIEGLRGRICHGYATEAAARRFFEDVAEAQ
jgi:hypothetical protein